MLTFQIFAIRALFLYLHRPFKFGLLNVFVLLVIVIKCDDSILVWVYMLIVV